MSFVIMRLTTGEQLMATFDSEDHTHYHIANPLVVRMIPTVENGNMVERVTAQPFCQFTSDKYFDIPKSSVMFVKPLHQILVNHYLRIVESYDDTVLVRNPQQARNHEQLDWGDEEEMTADDFREKIDRLSDFLQNASDRDELEEDTSVIVEGNDTIH